MYTVYFIFFQVASATATRFGLSRGLLGLQYDQINESESESGYIEFAWLEYFAVMLSPAVTMAAEVHCQRPIVE